MNHNALSQIVLLCLLMFSTNNYARDTTVTSWTEQVLMSTLTVNYTTTPHDFLQVRPNYSLNAWNGLSEFLGDAMNSVRREKLSLHPTPLNPATIVKSGVFSGIKYWRVNQSIEFTELNLMIDFSLIVLKATNPPYIIQSLSMIKHNISTSAVPM